MTREIKFRAKSIDGQLVYGTPIKTHIGTYMVTEENPHVCSVYGYMEIDEFVKVDENTIGQFTGLHDKNGKEIYEGDILRKSTFVDIPELYLDRDTMGVVRILPSCGTTICNCINCETDDPYEGKKMKGRTERVKVVGKRSEVIGNIYDNPELLKGGKP